MSKKVVEKEEGWQVWLHNMELWDPCLGEDKLYVRYKCFKDIQVGVVSEEFKRRMFRDLLTLEKGLVYGDAIGKVRDL